MKFDGDLDVKIWASPVLESSYQFLSKFFKYSESFKERSILQFVFKIGPKEKYEYFSEKAINANCISDGKYCIPPEASKNKSTKNQS